MKLKVGLFTHVQGGRQQDQGHSGRNGREKSVLCPRDVGLQTGGENDRAVLGVDHSDTGWSSRLTGKVSPYVIYYSFFFFLTPV